MSTGNIDVDLIDALDEMEKLGHIKIDNNGRIKLTKAGIRFAKELEQREKNEPTKNNEQVL